MNYKRLFRPYFWKAVWYEICAFFNPRQKWLTKHIPNTWRDKPELIQDILFACLVDYVEQEEGLIPLDELDSHLDDEHLSQEYKDSVVESTTELHEVYNYIKNELPSLEKSRLDFAGDLDFNEWIKLDALMSDKNMWAMTTIVKHSQTLWT